MDGDVWSTDQGSEKNSRRSARFLKFSRSANEEVEMMSRSLRHAAIASVLMSCAVAQAHTHLTKADPANGSVVAAAPERITLQFSEAVRVTAVSIQKEGEASQKLGPLPEQKAATVSLPVTGQGAGKYVITYRVVSGDGHVMGGEVRFTVDATASK